MRQPARHSTTTGRACPSQVASAISSIAGAPREPNRRPRSISPASGDSANCFPFYRTEEDIVTIGEGRTVLQQADLPRQPDGMKPGHLLLQYEGLNPSGSFKDNGMTAAFTHARMVGAKKVACASTGNTSASLALFASLAEMQGIVFIGTGKISFGKLSQALDYGALTLQIQGDFDACLRRVRQIAVDPGRSAST